MLLLKVGEKVPENIINPYLRDQTTAFLGTGGIMLITALENISNKELEMFYENLSKSQKIILSEDCGLIVLIWNQLGKDLWSEFIIHPMMAQAGYDIEKLSEISEKNAQKIVSIFVCRDTRRLINLRMFTVSNLFSRNYQSLYKKYEKEKLSPKAFNQRILRLHEKYPEIDDIANQEIISYEIGSEEVEIN